MPSAYKPVTLFVMAPGAFLVLAMLTAIQNKLKLKGANRHVKGNGGCDGDCANCPSREEENNG